MKRILLLVVAACFFVLSSCEKDRFTYSSDATLRITADTIQYDTVFTSIGSTTRSFKVINTNNKKLRINEIKLLGSSAAFQLNINGTPANQVSNLELAANDSLYVFVQVNINPNSNTLPFIIQDSIGIFFNNKQQLVQLEAWGQNAFFLRNKMIEKDTSFTQDRPIVIVGGLTVNKDVTLTLNKGVKIYTHANAPIVVNGTLNGHGGVDSTERIYFLGARRDLPYSGYPSSWPGITFSSESNNNHLSYTVLRNAHTAIGITNSSLQLEQVIIHNAYEYGIESIGSNITAINTLISNCGQNLNITGGEYLFNHCTFAAIGNNMVMHRLPSVSISDTKNEHSLPLHASFTNTLIWGENGGITDEVSINKEGSAAFHTAFNHVLWKVSSTPAHAVVNNIINQQDPQFDSINTQRHYYNFRLKDNSPAKNAGVAGNVLTDLDGKNRNNVPTIGAYE